MSLRSFGFRTSQAVHSLIPADPVGHILCTTLRPVFGTPRQHVLSKMEPDGREPKAKRRKVRKGTRSCWECKGRKVRCTYAYSEDTTCDGCLRRGTRCVGQDLPEQPLAAVDRSRQIGNRMVRVEALIERLVKQNGAGSLAPYASILRPGAGSVNAEAPASLSVEARTLNPDPPIHPREVGYPLPIGPTRVC